MNVSPALLSVIAFVALNSILFAFYLGKLSAQVRTNADKLGVVDARIGRVEEGLERSGRSDIGMKFRVEGLEKLEQKVEDLREEVISSRTAGETERRAIREHGEKMELQIGGIHRQLANIASGKTGLLQIIEP